MDYGITPEQMLLLDDKDLRQILPMSLISAPYKSIPPKKIKEVSHTHTSAYAYVCIRIRLHTHTPAYMPRISAPYKST